MSGASPAAPAWVRPLFLRAARAPGKARPLAAALRAALALLLLILSAQPAQPSGPEPSQELLAAAPALLPPFYVPAADGSPGGFAVELLRRVAAEAGYSLRIIPAGSLRAAEDMLRKGQVQAMPSLGVSQAREGVVLFTRPFDVQPSHIFYRAGDPPLESLDALAGRRLVLVASSIPAQRLLGRDDLDIRHAQTLSEAIFDVLAGKADALIYVTIAVEQAARAAGVEGRLGRSQRPVFEIGRAIAVSPDHPEVLERLDRALENFRKTPDFRRLHEAWHPEKETPHFSPAALWAMAALAVALTVGLLAWRYSSLLLLNRRLGLAVAERDSALAAQRHTEERLEALFTLSHMEADGVGEIVEFALEHGVRLTGSQIGYLYFVNGATVDLGKIHWSRSAREGCALLQGLADAPPYPIAEAGLWTEALRTLSPCIVNDYADHPGRRALPQGHCPLSRFMAVPLVEGGQAVALFGVGNKPEPYNDADARQLQLFLAGLDRVLKARRDAEAIQQARDYAESLLAGANAMVVGLDREGRVTAFNAAAEELTGRTRADVLGTDWFMAPHQPGCAQESARRYREIMDGARELSRNDESALMASDGRWRLISWRNSLLRQDGRVTGLIAFGIDITERKKAEAALEEQASETLTLFNGAPALIFYKSLDNRVLRANAAWFSVHGLDESVLGRPLDEFFPRHLAQRFFKDDQEVCASGQPKMNIVEEFETPGGPRRFVTHKLPRRDAAGAITGLICVASDVTDLERTEAALRESEEMYRTLAEDSPALIARFLPGGILTYVNPALCAAFGRTSEQLTGTCLLEHVPKREHAAILARFASLTPESPVAVTEQEVILPGGRVGWQQWTDRALFDASGQAVAFQSVGMDITQRRQAEADLRLLHRAIEQAAEGVLIADRDGAITYMNPALERMTGLSGPEIGALGMGLLKLPLAELAHRDSVVGEEKSGGVWRGESSLARPQGQDLEVEFTVSAIHDADGEVTSFVAVCRDVTEKRLLERQLWQAQKMEALGTLAGGIAHDFNNILASILGFTELALDDIPPEGRARSSLARVLKASSRAKELVRQILTFSRRAEREQRTLDADQSIGEALRLMEATLPKDVEIVTELEADGACVLADPSQIHQIVLNLCTNAAHAMPEGGRITVGTARARIAADPLLRLAAGEYLRLVVRDTGAGIAPEILGRVFDPFFTTKDSGQGTGLGLAVVHGIASSLGGSVRAESKPGRGACFTVLLPTAPAAAEAPDKTSPAACAKPGGSERILLVDDEADLLDMVRQTLEPMGYQVSCFTRPQEALEAFLASPRSYDLALTDQSMPALTGVQLASRLREVRPDLPVVLCSGFSMVIPPDRIQALGEAWLLSKPFTADELARTVRGALAATTGGTP